MTLQQTGQIYRIILQTRSLQKDHSEEKKKEFGYGVFPRHSPSKGVVNSLFPDKGWRWGSHRLQPVFI